MKRFFVTVAACCFTVSAQAQDKPKVDAAKVDAEIAAAFQNVPAELRGRAEQDETMKQCSLSRNKPSKDVAEEIQKRERAQIKYPADGKLVGDWASGEKIAQSGYGLRFTDYPVRQANGGNCYACHQLSKAEVSYGTIGPSLLNYGKIRNFREADAKAVYDKIYDAQASFACSNMPRLGLHGVLTIEQIKDLVALVMSPDSPVNK